MEFKNLLVEIEDGIAVVTINRPKALNALPSSMPALQISKLIPMLRF